jgi:hypothetical protein
MIVMIQMKWIAWMKKYYLDELDNVNEIDKIDGIQPYGWTSLHENDMDRIPQHG